MEIKKASFVVSNTDYKKCPTPDKPEYAFIGRSNVGKSSLINALVGRKLAKTSQEPGKTQVINHFLINDSWYLVDLPGYGYAKVSQSQRDKFAEMIDLYLQHRPNLICTFVLIDSRIPAQTSDLEFMQGLAQRGLPFVMIFTKTDKQSSSKTQSLIAAYKREMLKTWEELPMSFQTSSMTKTGIAEIIQFIARLNHDFKADNNIPKN